MTVVAKGEDELMALVDKAARPAVLEALEDHSHVAQESLATATAGEDRERWERQLAVLSDLRHQVDGTVGQAHLTGPEELIARILKGATSIATNDLDVLVEQLSNASERMDVDARELLRARAAVVATCVETLIACEASRRT